MVNKFRVLPTHELVQYDYFSERGPVGETHSESDQVVV